MSRNQTGGTELIPMPHPTEAAQLSLPIILYGAVGGQGVGPGGVPGGGSGGGRGGGPGGGQDEEGAWS